MKVKLGIIIENQVYLKRLTTSFINFYANECEIFSFSNFSSLLEAFKIDHFDLLIADESFEVKKLPENVTLIYITNKRDLDFISEIPAIYMYQNIDDMYRIIKEIYISNIKVNEYKRNTKVHGFISAKGGVGTTSICLAFLRNKVEDSNKIFYLTLDMYEDSKNLFKEKGIDIEEAFLTMRIDKNKFIEILDNNKNLHHFSDTKNIQNRKNIEIKDYLDLINLLRKEDYEIIIDLSSDIPREFIEKNILDRLYIVSDGRKESIVKNKKLISYIEEINGDLLKRTRVIFNKKELNYIEEDFGLKVSFEFGKNNQDLIKYMQEELNEKGNIFIKREI